MSPKRHQDRAFFGRRKGHTLRPRHARLIETLLPQLAIDLSNPAPAELSALFPVPVDDAVNLMAWLPQRALTRIDLIHPDPWPKRRHWKRRFVQDAMVSRLARILASGGEFRFVTDITDYAAWTLQRLLRSADFEWTAEGADDWRKAWPGFINTRYHAKAAREERASCFLIFRKV